MKKPHLSIIIPVLNLWELTGDCLKSVREQTPGNFFEVIVVDNGSTDATPQECPVLGNALFGDRFRYVRVEQNINFGPGCNLGAQSAQGEMLFFLNNDTLLTKNWFAPLFEAFQTDFRLMAVSPVCLFPESGRVQHLGIAFDGGLGVRHPYYFFPGDHAVVRRYRHFQALSGAAFMVQADTFRKLEGFYPEYANGFEDIDLCCRIRRTSGKLAVVNNSRIYHLTSQTPGRNRSDRENIDLVNRRCEGGFRPDLHTFARQDGYFCELTPWLAMVIRQPDSKKLERFDALTGKSEIEAALNEEPLWEAGYDRLARILTAEEDHGQAAQYLLYGTNLFPDVDRLGHLQAAAIRAGEKDIGRHAESAVSGIRDALASPQTLRQRAENILSWARANKDNELIRIYEKWLNSG